MKKYEVLTFDIVGTLIDFEKGILEWFFTHYPNLANKSEEVLELWGVYERNYIEKGDYTPFTTMYGTIFQDILAYYSIVPDPKITQSFKDSIALWPPYDDSVETMSALGENSTLIAATNADNKSIEGFQKSLQYPFRKTYSSEDFQSYKPGNVYFKSLEEKITAQGFSKTEWLHVAQSQYHDIHPMLSRNVDTAWVERRAGKNGSGATPGVKPAKPTYHLGSMKKISSLLSTK